MKNKVIFLLGRTVSLLGTQIYNFVFALMILYTTGSAINFAITIALETIPRILFSTVAGIVADRFNRKKIIVYSDLISGLLLLSAFCVMKYISSSIIIVFALTFVLNSINTFFDISMTSSLDALFSEDGMESICSINEGMGSLISLLAPTIGAAWYAVSDFKVFILINGISFIISSVTEIYLDYPQEKKMDKKHTSLKEEFLKTFSFLKSEKVVFDLYFVAIFINIFYGIAVTLSFPIILTKYLNISEVQYGIIETIISVGMLTGATIFSVFKIKKRYGLIITSLMAEALSIMLIAVPLMFNITKNYFYSYILIAFVLGFSVSSVNINVRVLMQKIIPRHIKGKVLGTLSSMCLSISPIVVLSSSFYVNTNNPIWLVLGCGILFILMNTVLAFDKELKKI